jgi:hypothetical protein
MTHSRTLLEILFPQLMGDRHHPFFKVFDRLVGLLLVGEVELKQARAIKLLRDQVRPKQRLEHLRIF